MSDSKTMIKALRVLSRDIQSGDGVANACVADAANMIENMSTQLAKANERVRELEKYNVGLANESHRKSVAIEKADKRLIVSESRLKESNKALAEMFWYFTPDGDKYPLAEQALNKFAIEKKIEAFNAVKNEIKTVGGLELCDAVEFIDDQIEQLRKEQE